MGAEVVTLYDANMRDIPAMLRRLADQIEGGEVDARQAACVVETKHEVVVYGWGDSTILGSIGLLTIGAQRLSEVAGR